MSKFVPSVYQQKIYDFITNGSGNAVVSAVAGSGKTTTLINAIKLIPKDKNLIFLAFNKSIAGEIRERVPQDLSNIDVKTVHGYGFSAIQKSFSCEIDNRKYRKILNDIILFHQTNEMKVLDKYAFDGKIIKLCMDFAFQDGDAQLIEDKTSYFNRVISLTDLGRLNLIDLKNMDNGIDQLNQLAKKHDLTLIDGECFRAWLLINIGASYTFKVDFTDMVFLPIHYKIQTVQYDIVFIDECQDLNACQRELMKKAMKPKVGRFVAVGDKHQCQPPETLITLSNTKQVRIDEVKVGDSVVSYNAKYGKGFVGYYNSENSIKRYSKDSSKILEIAKHEYKGDLIKITTDSNKSSKYTLNHKCIVKYKDSDIYILYLMEKDDCFRIGIHPAFCKRDFGLSSRSRQEKSSKSWILKTYQKREDAYYDEQYYSYEYGIPQLRFRYNYTGTMNQKEIDNVWIKFNKEKMKLNALELLELMGRNYEYPFWHLNSNLHNSRAGVVEVQSCNLIPELMLVATFNSENKIANKPFKAVFESFNIEKEKFKGLVYSLKVSKEENYVADNILTHNSIYGFAGSDADSFEQLVNQKDTIKLPLSVCYRCGTDIINLAKKIMPTIEASPTAKKGMVDYDSSYKNLQTGDMVICRNTAPLVSLCMKLLIANKKSYVMGTDISKNLINLVESCKKKSEEFSVENVFARIYKEKEKMIANISKKEKITISEAKDTQLIDSLSDKIVTLEILSKGCIMADELIDKLKSIFSDDTDGICLSTIHKSKGLEADRVYIIHSDLMPSKYAKQDWEIEQEKNLEYVAITRAKSVLGYITDFDAYKDIESQDKGKEVKDSQFVGIQGGKSIVVLTIVEIKEMNTSWGDTTLFTMTDSNGNLFTKFGSIPERFLISNHSEIEVGSIVEFNATIKQHSEFRGTKTNVISTISKS